MGILQDVAQGLQFERIPLFSDHMAKLILNKVLSQFVIFKIFLDLIWLVIKV